MRKSRRNGAVMAAGAIGVATLAFAAAGWIPRIPSSMVAVVDGGDPGPSPTSTPTPAPTGAPTPAPTPVATEPEPYTLGSMTWHFASDAPQWKRDQIFDSMDWTINQINTLTDFHGNVRTVYSEGTPTADAGFLGQIRFGGQSNRRTALHEISHWLGTGSVADYGRRVVGGVFTGAITDQRIRGYDGPDARLWSNGVHYWPYGMNYDNEFVEAQRTIGLISSQRADMGWGDGTAAIAGVRRFQNRSSRMILDSGSGSAPLQQPNGTAATQTWRTGYVDGYVTLVADAGNLALDSLGTATDGAATGMRSAAGSDIRQHWEMIPTDNGWFLLRNRATGKCLDNHGSANAGAAIGVWACGGHPNQQWHLVR